MEKSTTFKTRELFHTINNYCEHNNLALFNENRGYFYRFFISSKEEFLKLKEQDVNITYEKFNKDFFDNTSFDIFLHKGNMNCSLQASNELSAKCFNELLVEVFWNCEKDSVKIFFEHFDFDGKNINFNYIINYSNEKFPDGFADDKVRPYDKGLNWHHFLDILPSKSIVNFFEDEEKREQFFKLMRDCEDSGKLKSNSFLNKIRMKIEDSEVKMSQNTNIEMSYLLMDLYKDKKDSQRAYSVVFPFMTALIEEQEKNELFKQDANIIEKVTLKINDIYRFFGKDSGIKAEDYEKLSNEIIINISDNQELQELGLLNIDLAKKDRDFICYLNLIEKSRINKEYFLELYKESMYLSINVCAITDKEFSNKMKEIVERVISVKLLNDELSYSSNKIKKFKI